MADGAHHTQMSAMHADGRPEAPAGNTETARAIRDGNGPRNPRWGHPDQELSV